ncbi:Eco57I restriction-modification methylase domain-containing protein [Methylorubrum extorquens]|uniref:Eco57I restriction-modification methylase domain-containing protein n=1 Tax=Methylorubrum extorquens TaxID=408 RepID=UPI000158FBA8|nr:N-6 DNA methylase [Methylorubrum extorquens]ABY28696.1 putative type II DNA modification enzyme [Methylorubrum extorquens PA1]KQP85783.1 restriction endonuclease [Methylobacterium sp. Leaf119]WIU40075.1 N-6 DNA methylase [Methylorubrum extorquens]
MARQPRPAARTRRAKRTPAIAFDAITLEGGLIAPAMLTQIARIEADEQTPADYGVARGLILRDEIARAYRIAQAHYEDLTAHPEPSLAATQRFTEALLREVLEFRDLVPVGRHDRDGDIYPVTFEGLGGRVPVVVVPPSDGIDRVSASLMAAGRRGSAASVVQDWLNAEDAALWGLACCGTRLRLLRDNPSLTRPAYIEADLDAIFTNEGRVDFAVLWLLLHATRFGKPADAVTDCTLERWRLAGLKEGEVARDRLRDGVEEALLALGTGFLGHPANAELRKFVGSGVIPAQAYFEQCLHLVYRLIFLFVAEDRDLLHPKQTAAMKRQRYAQGYSVSALRQASIRRSGYDAYSDRWEALKIVFEALAEGQDELGLPPLAGLFVSQHMDDLEQNALSNRDLLKAIYRLAWLKTDDGVMPVNWRDMQTEELGSVYESLLELTPRISADGREMLFAEGLETRGNARKTTGSYYTPDSLVQVLLDTTIDPVMDQAVAGAADPVRALLGLRVIDPACGSGHFLLAAARRLAARVARARNDGVASAEQYRDAVRDVVRQCIHGVDRNPMAVDLTKVALWIESIEPGKPLGFLDGNIVCGDALLGTFGYGEKLDAVLDAGIPEEAYKPLTGDDRDACRRFVLAERDDRSGAMNLFDQKGWKPLEEHTAELISTFKAMAEDTPGQIKERQELWIKAMNDPGLVAKKHAADLYLGAFLTKKGPDDDPFGGTLVPRTADIIHALHQGSVNTGMLSACQERTDAARVLHWGLTFGDVFDRGGFDVVIGNPPWERIKLQEQEFFASLDAEVAEARNAAVREALIQKMKVAEDGSRKRAIYDAYETAKRASEATSAFMRLPDAKHGRFKLTGRGDVNTYALFAELFTQLAAKRGRAGIIVPTGIATDATTAPFFEWLVREKRLISLYDFENRERLFPAVDSRMKFSLLTTGSNTIDARFAFFLTNVTQIADLGRSFSLSQADIIRINPNIRTAPVFRTEYDAGLVSDIYSRVPVLIQDGLNTEGNPWNISVQTRLWHMAEDSHWFKSHNDLQSIDPDLRAGFKPLYEAKMLNFFDHRFGSYDNRGDERGYRVLPPTTADLYADPNFEPSAYYLVPETEVEARLAFWNRDWLIAFKDVTAATNERTTIFSFLPRTAVGHSAPLLFTSHSPQLATALVANLNSLIVDYCARTKIGGLHLTIGILKQLPILQPDDYEQADLEFISSRVLELSYTSHAMQPLARDLGYDGPPYRYDEDRRAKLRAELDAWFARAYGLNRDELLYILDPTNLTDAQCVSETFRVLKNNEFRRFGEYRTQRLVLEAFDDLHGIAPARAAAE